MRRHPPRDSDLIDALEACAPISLKQSLWRVVRDKRDPCQCSKPGGRWDDESVEVLYTAHERDGALAEMHFHLRKGQPVIPPKIRYRLHELQSNLENVLDLSDRSLLTDLGVDMAKFGQMTYVNKDHEYVRTQIIGETANFLGFNAILVPNARWNCNNIVLFCDSLVPDQLDEREDHGIVDWKSWEKETEDTR